VEVASDLVALHATAWKICLAAFLRHRIMTANERRL
jgi:hypothetical protein